MSDAMQGIPYRLLRLSLRDGKNLDFEIADKVSDDGLREAFQAKISEVVLSPEELEHGRHA